jgi:hypothetical protein
MFAAGTLMQLLMNLGSMFGYCVGPYVSYTTFGVLSAMFPAVFLGLMLFMPETPHFLLVQGRRDEAEVTLMRLRGRFNRQDIQVRNSKPQHKMAEKGNQASRLNWISNFLIPCILREVCATLRLLSWSGLELGLSR